MKKAFLTVSLIMTSSMAVAGGFQLQEYSITNLGRAFGGAGLVGDDYAAIALNPAGMQLKDSGIQAGATFVRLRTMFNGKLDSASGGSQDAYGKSLANKLLPHFFAQKRLNDRWTIGTGFYAPFGLGTFYKDKEWVGASHAINTSIVTTDLAVAASYKLSQTLSLGGSVFYEYLKARLTSGGGANSDMRADDNGTFGYSVGLMYEPVKNTRFGVTYRSKTIHDISGTHHLGPYTGSDTTKLVLPEHVLLSAYQKIGKWGLGALARWTRWSRFDTLNIRSNAYAQFPGIGGNPHTPSVEENWRNVWMIGGSVDYDLNKNWTVRSGLAYDQGGVKRAKTRTARAPDTDRWVTAFGASYRQNNWQWDIAYSHVFWKTGHANNTLSSDGTTLRGRYRSTFDMVGAGFQYNF